MSKVAAFILAGLIFFSANQAHAIIFIDFDSPAITPDAVDGDFNHLLDFGSGRTLSFNGNISNNFDGLPLPDVTSGSGYFLRDSSANNIIVFDLSFQANRASFWVYGDENAILSVAGYDENDQFLGLFLSDGVDNQWRFYDSADYVDPSIAPNIRKVTVSSIGTPGSRWALDNVTLFPADEATGIVPEPASLMLMGSGLLGLLGGRRKK